MSTRSFSRAPRCSRWRHWRCCRGCGPRATSATASPAGEDTSTLPDGTSVWELIAAIGRVESDHGRYNANTLTSAGVSRPGVHGIALNGKNGTRAINDTDGGRLDQDAVVDRAVGSMPCLPSTWQVVTVDADSEGQRNPQDIDDAALATAGYLCSGQDNLSERSGREAAVYRYNHSKDYVHLALRITETYGQGDYTAVPSGTAPAVKQREASQKAAKVRVAEQRAAGASSSPSSSSSSSGSSSTGVNNVPSTSSTTTSGSGCSGSGGGSKHPGAPTSCSARADQGAAVPEGRRGPCQRRPRLPEPPAVARLPEVPRLI